MPNCAIIQVDVYLPGGFSPGLAKTRRVKDPRTYPKAGPRILAAIVKLNAIGPFSFSLLSSTYGIPKENILVLPMPTVKIPTNMIPTLTQSFCVAWLSQSSLILLSAEHKLLDSPTDSAELTAA